MTIPVLLAQLGLPLLVRAVGAALGSIDHPTAKGAAAALDDAARAIGAAQIAPAQVAEANRHIERMAELALAERREDGADWRATIAQVNATMRAEAQSEEAFVRRARPTFTYAVAASWTAQMAAIAWLMVAEPQYVAETVAALADLTVIWSVGLSVLGVYVFRRTSEKTAARAG